VTYEDPTAGDYECGDDVAAYALGALDAADAERFERHLTHCAVCPDELSAFRQVVGTLRASAPIRPAPGELRQRVLRAVTDEPAGTARVGSGDRLRPRRPRLRVRRHVWAPGAVLACALLAVAGVTLTTNSSATVRVIHAHVSGQGTAELRVRNDRGELVLHHFSPPPAGQIYEVWFKRSAGAPAPANALFSVTAGGEADVVIPRDIRGVQTVTVTPEPAGGTRSPTHPAVVRAVLT
jgi:anti-sigma-K factor RskA